MNIIIDAGGTNTRIGFSPDLNTFSDIIKFPTPKKYSDFIGILNNHIKDAGQINSIVLGIAGFVNREDKKIIKCPHIPYLINKCAHDLLTVEYENLYVENDASLAGLAEAIKGEGKNYKNVAYITISTGVGGTLICNKELPKTRFNLEPGHHIINFHGRELALKHIRGSWENFSSGTGFKNRYGIEPSESIDPNIWNEYGEMLAVGLHNITLLWQPDVIVLGGSMSKKAGLFLSTVENQLKKSAIEFKPDIKISTLGDENGLLGGLEYLRKLR